MTQASEEQGNAPPCLSRTPTALRSGGKPESASDESPPSLSATLPGPIAGGIPGLGG